jgi:flagellar hook-length control protein FliK
VSTAPAAPAPIAGARPDPTARTAAPTGPARTSAEVSTAPSGALAAPTPNAGPASGAVIHEPLPAQADGAPAASGVTGATGAAAPREAATPVFDVATPVAGPEWPDEVAKGLAHIVSLRLADAEIRLNPAHLGPIGIEISYNDNQASVLITAAQPATRDALEQALPHLKELLAQQGIALGESTVRGEGQSRSDPDAAAAHRPAPSAPGEVAADASPSVPDGSRHARASGRIDTFA